MARRLYGPTPGEPEALRAVPDLAGLPVDDAEGNAVGRVYGSLTDDESGLVRYLDVALDDADRHVLIPIGHSQIRGTGAASHVHLRAAVRRDLNKIPPYESDTEPVGRTNAIDVERQRSLLAAHGRLFRGERYYAHPAFDHSGLYAGEHPIVHRQGNKNGGVGDAASPLRPLGELPGFRIARSEYDIRGWPLVSAEGDRVGKVEDLLIDTGRQKVRYAVIAERSESPKRLLLPVGFLSIEPQDRHVHASVLTREDFRALPPAPGRPPEREWERRLRKALDRRLDGKRLFYRPDYGAIQAPRQP